jgi:predicted PurR-regulated permease PerM
MTTTTSSVIKKLLLLFLVLAGLYYAKVFLVPLCIAAILATLFLPFCNWLEKHKVPKWGAAFICLLILLIVILGFVAVLIWQIGELTSDIGLVKAKAIELVTHVQDYLFTQFGITIAKQDQLLNAERPSYTSIMQLLVESATYIFTTLILILAYVVLLLYYRGHIKQFFIKITLPPQQDEMGEILNNAAHVSHQYLIGLSKMILFLWIMYGIGFSILGVKNALFFAILCGVLEIVPFVGNITGTTLTTLFAALHGASDYMLIGIIITYAVIQFIQSWFLEPLILGAQVKLNPFFTIIALVLGNLIWGILGIILAIPLTGMLKIVCDHIDSLKPYGFLIGEVKRSKSEKLVVKKMKNIFTNSVK